MDDDDLDDATDFCRKCKRESRWCAHRKHREVAKDAQNSVLTTN